MNILNRARRALSEEEVSVRDVVESLGRASFSPLLMVPALLVVTPASGIPFFSTICGVSIALISFQMIAHRRHVWLPKWIMRRHANRNRIAKGLDWLTPPARWLDRITHERLCPLVEPPLLIVPQLICLAAGAMMPVLELVPFTSSILGFAVSILAVAMVTRDGLLVIVGLSAIATAFAVGNYFLM
ncbi:exopolysaccharide biosynthesis protein [Maritimibacter sp. UBA3975]|uniref:exopolysaccharide biosynthesis protein n=1 Tax=Maritimibacter sp. UBA3975 TaxID=1946833 RepID=UPI0025BA87E5|nr:exopolysaccharide biosynthesis protein [Maritimibacter sp. UBA3975]